jgi:protein O-mannosyl-transferase
LTALPSSDRPQQTLTNEGARNHQWLWVGGLLVLLLTIAAHARGLQGQFLEWDDYSHITQNPLIRSLSPTNLWRMFTEPTAKLYVPLTWVSLAIDYQVWGQIPFGYHLTNLLLHAANTLLVLLLVFQLLRGRFEHAQPAAVLTAAIFGVHPLRVESVAWVTERKDLLFAFFYLLAMLAYLRWVVRGNRRNYWGCLLLFVCSALAKSTAVTLPLVLVLLDVFWKRRVAVWEKIPFFAVSLIIGTATFIAQASGKGETVMSTEVIPLWARLGLVGYCTLFHVGKFLWPFHLSAVYPSFEDFGWTPPQAVAYLLAFTVLLATAFAFRRRAPIVLPSWLFYLITLSPTIGLIPVGVHVVADRFTYVPLIGLALPLSVGVLTLANNWRRAQPILAATIATWLVALAILSAKRSAIWSNTEALFHNALAENPNCYPALVNLTTYYTSTKQFDEAIDCGTRAVAVAPNGLVGRKSLASALVQARRYREAIKALQPAIDHGIDDRAVWQTLKECFTALGDEKNARLAETRMLRSM